MSNLSWHLSHRFQRHPQHAEGAFRLTKNPVKDLAPKLNMPIRTARHTNTSTRENLRIWSTEFSDVHEREQGRRWSKWLIHIERHWMLFTIEEVAKDHLKVSRATVYRLIRRGELRASKVLGCTRIDPKELARYEQMIGGVR